MMDRKEMAWHIAKEFAGIDKPVSDVLFTDVLTAEIVFADGKKMKVTGGFASDLKRSPSE